MSGSLRCSICGASNESMFEVRLPGMHKPIVFCSEECYQQFQKRVERARKGKEQKLKLKKIAPLNAIIVSVIDHQTIGVVFLPDGEDIETIRLHNVHLFKSESQEEQRSRYEAIKSTIALSEDTDKERFLAAYVSLVGKNAEGMWVCDVFVAFGCSIDIKMMQIVCVTKDSLIINLETIAEISALRTLGLLEKTKKPPPPQQSVQSDATLIDAKHNPYFIQAALKGSKHIGYLRRMAARHHIGTKGQSLKTKQLDKLMNIALKTPGKADDRRVRFAKLLAKLRLHKKHHQ
jgi:hypothetical protein